MTCVRGWGLARGALQRCGRAVALLSLRRWDLMEARGGRVAEPGFSPRTSPSARQVGFMACAAQYERLRQSLGLDWAYL